MKSPHTTQQTTKKREERSEF